MNRSQQFLTIYSGILTAVFALTVLTGVTKTRKSSFEELDVQRINIVEPDGTLRMVISDKTRFPGLILKGKEFPHPNRRTAGMLFFDDEGTENGGLTFGGGKGKDGKASSGGHLSFDQYHQDQIFTIDAAQNGSERSSTLMVADRPDWPIDDLVSLLTRIRDLPADQQKVDRDNGQQQSQRRHEEDNRALALEDGHRDSTASSAGARFLGVFPNRNKACGGPQVGTLRTCESTEFEVAKLLARWRDRDYIHHRITIC